MMGVGEITGSMVLARKDTGQELMDLLDKLGIAAWFTDKAGVVDDCNKTACTLVDRTREETVGVGLVEELVGEKDREEAKGAVEKAVGGAESDVLGMSVVRKDGSSVGVTCDVGPRMLGVGEITGSMVVARKEASQEVMDVLDKVGIAAWFTDKAGVVDDCNSTAFTLVDRTRE